MNANTNNEVARLREEVKNWHQHYRDEASKAQKCKQAYIEQEKEVAKLRELFEKAISALENLNSGTAFVKPQVLREELARLAPTPEEPVIQDFRITEIDPVPTQPPTQNEWRELGPDEVICEYDQYKPTQLGAWTYVPNYWIGTKPDRVIRTRRPVPKQEEKCQHHSIVPLEYGDEILTKCLSCWQTLGRGSKPKQEEMPLEALHAWMLLQEDINKEIAGELQKFHDEIQKLKSK